MALLEAAPTSLRRRFVVSGDQLAESGDPLVETPVRHSA
jgi:hypothetical protein